MMRWEGNNMEPRQNPGPRPAIWESAQGEPEESGARDYLAALARRKWVWALVMAAFVALGVFYIETRKPMYESTAQIVVVSSNEGGSTAPENDIPLINDLRELTRSRSVNTQVEVISSPDVIDDAYKGISDEARKAGFGSSSAPSWAYRIEGVKDTDIIRIRAKAYTPEAAATFANSIAAAYFQRDRRTNTEEIRKAREFAETNAQLAFRSLEKANSDLTGFKQRTGFISPDAQLAKAVERSTDMAMNVDQADADVQAGQNGVAALESQLAKQGQSVETSRNLMRNPRLNSIVARIDALNSERITLLQEYTATSPEVQKINESIRQEEARLRQVTQTVLDSKTVGRNPVRESLVTKYATDVASLAASSARARALQSALSTWQESLQQMPAQEREYLDLAQKVAVAQKTYDMLAGKYRTLLLSEQTVMPKGMLISSASPSAAATLPDKKRAMMAFVIVGAIAATLCAIAADRRDKRAYSRQIIERITGLDTLAMLPEMSRRSPRLLSYNGGNSALLESFRMLRNSIAMAEREASPRIIAITSASCGEGKSTTAINLATAMAMDGRRTLLVDADLRKPSIHKLLSLPNDSGLSAVLRSQITLEGAVLATRDENVFCLPAGPVVEDYPELLNKPYTRDLFSDMRKKYDMVILDCPPCAGLSEMQVIPGMVDAVLLVVSMKSAILPRLRATVMSLLKCGAPYVGLVTNRVRMRPMTDDHISSYCSYAEAVAHNGGEAKRSKVKTG